VGNRPRLALLHRSGERLGAVLLAPDRDGGNAIRTLAYSARRKAMGVVHMYTISSDTVGLAVGPISETANNLHEALTKARQMYETGLVNVSIKDEAGHKIDGDQLLACMTGHKKITEDLRAIGAEGRDHFNDAASTGQDSAR
jgi:hypothetical protein